MTIEQLLKMSGDELERMSNAQVLEYFKDKLPITRPSPELRLANSGKAKSGRKTVERQGELSLGRLNDIKLQRAIEIARAAGIDLDLSELQ